MIRPQSSRRLNRRHHLHRLLLSLRARFLRSEWNRRYKLSQLFFEDYGKTGNQFEDTLNNLGYIVLSRASIDLTLAHKAASSTSAVSFVSRNLFEIHKSIGISGLSDQSS